MNKKIVYILSIFSLVLCSVFLMSCVNTQKKYNINFIVDKEVYATIETNGTDTIQMPEDPKKEDYIFEGWYWDEDIWKDKFTSKSLSDAALSSNMNVYAHFVDEFDLKGTEIEIKDATKLNVEGLGEAYYLSFSNSQIVCKFEDYVSVNPHTKWQVSTDVSGNNTITSKTVELEVGDSPVYYIYVTDKNDKHDLYFVMLHRNYMFDVTFNTNGGSSCSSVKVEEGKYLEDIPTSTKNGYSFGGWDYDFKNSPIKKNTTVNAIWNSNEYTITFDTNGGSIGQNTMTVFYNKSYALPTPTKKGYKFTGWFLNGSKITDGVWTRTNDISVVAQWELEYYSIDYELNGGTCNTFPTSYSINDLGDDKIDNVLNGIYKTGYTFKGWFDDEYFNYPYVTFRNLTELKNRKLYAKWEPNKFNITYDVNGGNALDSNTHTVFYGSTISLPTPNRIGYSFGGWYYNGRQISGSNWNIANDVTLRAKWTIVNYSISYTLNGGINNSLNPSYYTYESDDISLKEPTRTGYTFSGWTNDQVTIPTKDISITHNSTGSFSFVANWTANIDTPYKIEHYLQNIIGYYDSLPYEVDELTGTTDTKTNGEINIYEGFASPEITQVNIKGDGSTVIKLYYERNSYDVTLEKSIDIAGVITGAGTYKYDDKITIKATINVGYTFNGWYKNDKLYTDDVSFNYTIGASNVSFEARYTINQYIVSLDNHVEGLEITGIVSGNKYDFDTSISMVAKNNTGVFLIWVINGSIVYIGDNYSFNVPANDITIYVYTRFENKVYFGSYPQTKLNDNTLINELNVLAGELPTSTNKYNWVDYNYCQLWYIQSYMFYQDIDYDNDGLFDYRGVYFIKYRPSVYYSYSDPKNTNQDNNGYLINNIYWFRFDPIEWDILDESNGKSLIISNMVLDSQEFIRCKSPESQFEHNGGYGYANNYELSDIRKFLKENFFNTAFTDLQKGLIEVTEVDNSITSTGSKEKYKFYACNNTQDEIFLLSTQELKTYYASKLSRAALGTDYAKCQNFAEYNGGGWWWLRSPANLAYTAYLISEEGEILNCGFETYQSSIGVRPACWISL